MTQIFISEPAVYLPVAADQFISMRLQQQRPQDILHTARHILLRYSSEPGIHAQSFSSCHVVQHGVKLRAVTNALLHLQSRDKCPLSYLGLLKATWLYIGDLANLNPKGELLKSFYL